MALEGKQQQSKRVSPAAPHKSYRLSVRFGQKQKNRLVEFVVRFSFLQGFFPKTKIWGKTSDDDEDEDRDRFSDDEFSRRLARVPARKVRACVVSN